MLPEEMDHLLRGLWFHFQDSCKLVNYNASASEETLYSPLALKGNWLAFSKSQIYRFPENIYCKTSFLYACIIFTKYTEYKITYSFQSYGPPKESQNFYRLNRKHMETPLTVWLWRFGCIFCSVNVTLRSVYKKGGFCLLVDNFVLCIMYFDHVLIIMFTPHLPLNLFSQPIPFLLLSLKKEKKGKEKWLAGLNQGCLHKHGTSMCGEARTLTFGGITEELHPHPQQPFSPPSWTGTSWDPSLLLTECWQLSLMQASKVTTAS